MKILVIIPTYNEAENVKRMVGELLELNQNIEILIVDDNSPDKTWRIVEKIKHKNHRIHLIKNQGKIGLGPAYLIGFEYALKRKFDYIIQMDCDFSHDPKMIPSLIMLAKKSDFVIGSRYTRGGGISGWGWKRLVLSRFGNAYARFFLGGKIKDWTSGFICWREKTLRTVNSNIGEYPNGYAFLISIKCQALKDGFKCKEIPITFRDRIKGTTKMDGGIINEAAIIIIKLRLSRNKRNLS